MAEKKTRAELEAENRLRGRVKMAESVGVVAETLIRWGALVLIARYVFLTVQSLSGETTIADIGVRFLANVRVSEAVAWILAGTSTFYGLRQRKLRKDTIEREHGRVQELEQALDPGRTSSTLTTRGTTRPEDK